MTESTKDHETWQSVRGGRTYQVSLRGLAASTRQREDSVLRLYICVDCQRNWMIFLFYCDWTKLYRIAAPQSLGSAQAQLMRGR